MKSDRLSITYPTVIKENIFTNEELNNILEMFRIHDNLIIKYGDTEESCKVLKSKSLILEPCPSRYLGFFGAAWYWFRDRHIEVGKTTRDILLSHVNYDKILTAISNYTGIEAKLSDTINPPGFHIFHNGSDKEFKHRVNNWHNDKIKDMMTSSWLIPIVLPQYPTGIDYIDRNGSTQRFNYIENTLCGWDGRVKHTISSLTLKPTERRITLQAHSFYKNGILEVFW